MNEYLVEIGCDDFDTSDLLDEEIVYVVANGKIHASRKKKFKSRKGNTEKIYYSQ